MFTTPRFPKSSNEWDYAGSGYQGPKRGFSVQNVTSRGYHVEPPFPMANGFHIHPGGAEEAVRFITERGYPPKRNFGRSSST